MKHPPESTTPATRSLSPSPAGTGYTQVEFPHADAADATMHTSISETSLSNMGSGSKMSSFFQHTQQQGHLNSSSTSITVPMSSSMASSTKNASTPSSNFISTSTTRKLSLPRINTSRVRQKAHVSRFSKSDTTLITSKKRKRKRKKLLLGNSILRTPLSRENTLANFAEASPTTHQRKHRFVQPSIFCFLLCIIIAFVVIVLLSNVSWIISFSTIISQRNDQLTNSRFEGLHKLVKQKAKLPTVLASGLSQMNRFFNGSNDLEHISSEMFRFIIHTLPYTVGDDLNEVLEPYFTIFYRQSENHLVGFATKDTQVSRLTHIYMWPPYTGDNNIVGRYVTEPYTKFVDQSFDNTTEAQLNSFGSASLDNPDNILMNFTLSTAISNFFGDIHAGSVRGWRNSSVTCVLQSNCVHYISFYQSFHESGQAEVLYSTAAFSEIFRLSSDDALTFLMETKTQTVIASSVYLEHPTMDVKNQAPIHISKYTDSSIRDVGISLLEGIENNLYATGQTYQFTHGLEFSVDHTRIRDQMGLDMTLVHMTRLSPILIAPIMTSITIFTLTLIFLSLTTCISCFINVTIGRNLKSIQKNMLLVRDMKLDEIQRSTPCLVPFKEFYSIRHTFYDVLLPQMGLYRGFLPDHIIGGRSDSSSSSSSDSESDALSVQSESMATTTKHELQWLSEPITLLDAEVSTVASPVNDVCTVFSMASSKKHPVSSPHSLSGSEATPRKKMHSSKKKNKFSVGLRYGHITVLVLYYHNIHLLLKKCPLHDFVKQYSKYFQEVNFICRQYKAYLDNFSESIVVMTFKKPHLACECAIRLHNQLTILNNDLPHPSNAFEYSIGISTGKEWYGTIGETNLKKRHSFGSVSKKAKTLATYPYTVWKLRLWVDEQIKNEVGDEAFQFRPVMPLTTKDNFRTTAYQLVKKYVLYDEEWMYCMKLKEERNRNAEFCRAYHKFQNKAYGTARILFERLAEENPHDPVINTFIQKCKIPQHAAAALQDRPSTEPSIPNSSSQELSTAAHPLMAQGNASLSASRDSNLDNVPSPELGGASTNRTPNSSRKFPDSNNFMASDIDATLNEWDSVVGNTKT